MKKVVALVTIAAFLAVFTLIYFALRTPQRRRLTSVTRKLPETRAAVPASVPSAVDEWTGRFIEREEAGQWTELDRELDVIQASKPELYEKFGLGYLRARVKIELNDYDEAAIALQPMLEKGNRFRDLALFYAAEAAAEDDQDAAAAHYRETLIREFPRSPNWPEAIDDQIAYFTKEKNLESLKTLLATVASADRSVLREVRAAVIATEAQSGRAGDAVREGLALLRESISDDAAETVTAVLDQPSLIQTMKPQDVFILAQSDQVHRHFDRAAELFERVLPALPLQRDDIIFAMGRARFGNENYAEAEKIYAGGANGAKTALWKATFLFHQSRAAQLQGHDADAVRLMTAAIAVPGRFPATSAALTQRLRTALKGGDFAGASRDLAQLRRLFPNDHASLEGSVACAVALIARKRNGEAISILKAIPGSLVNPDDSAEISYWRARAKEKELPEQSLEDYLTVLRSPVSTHFAYFARSRIHGPTLSGPALKVRKAKMNEVARLIASGNFAAARKTQTDAVLLAATEDEKKELETLRTIYEELPPYRSILRLKPEEFPRFPTTSDDRGDLLMAMGLFDDATDRIVGKWSLRTAPEALTRSLALNRAAESRQSIGAVEVLMRSVPEDYVPDLLPQSVRELLYPRYFYPSIVEYSQRYEADPRLVLSIMREESRFNPRAKSAAAARGLLQFITTTARQVGQSLGLVDLTSEDLYDPDVIIRLGAKYIGELQARFKGNPYRASAAYNAGPNQVELWSRLSAGDGDDFFFSAIDFDETKIA